VKKGNGLQAAILDFSLQTLSGTDTTSSLLNSNSNYLLVLALNFDRVNDWKASFESVKAAAKQKGLALWLVTADATTAQQLFPGETILICDATVIKTAARVQPTFFWMQGANIQGKYPYTAASTLIGKLP
jgi:hypothetical protein